jgi:hypothetical protein
VSDIEAARAALQGTTKTVINLRLSKAIRHAASGMFTADAATADCGHACHVAVKSSDYIFHLYQLR